MRSLRPPAPREPAGHRADERFQIFNSQFSIPVSRRHASAQPKSSRDSGSAEADRQPGDAPPWNWSEPSAAPKGRNSHAVSPFWLTIRAPRPTGWSQPGQTKPQQLHHRDTSGPEFTRLWRRRRRPGKIAISWIGSGKIFLRSNLPTQLRRIEGRKIGSQENFRVGASRNSGSGWAG